MKKQNHLMAENMRLLVHVEHLVDQDKIPNWPAIEEARQVLAERLYGYRGEISSELWGETATNLA